MKLLAGLLVAVPLALSGGALASLELPAIRPAEVTGDTDQLSPSELDVLGSDEPKFITVDPYSGDVTAVEEVSQAELEAALEASQPRNKVTPFSWSTGCASGKPCWHDNPPGNINYQFSSGITNGTWDTVRNFYTGNYYAKLCWIPWNSSETFCMPERNGKNALIQIGMQVTGKKVDLSSTR
ncbi:hypothetical protein [Microbacterium sp. K2]|uniref:hypothetical protein n=1 Tax=Microbacterium sp. K2 TaxID=3391827 RepID=UPI003ED86989